jgi:anti-sigma factor RsiW
VPDLSAHGFELAGARRDVIDGQVVAVLVYRRRQHAISAFVRPATVDPIDRPTRRRSVRGFNVVELTHGGMGYWIVSDLNARDLGDFTELLVAGG